MVKTFQSRVYQRLDESASEQKGEFLASAVGVGGVRVVGGGEFNLKAFFC